MHAYLCKPLSGLFWEALFQKVLQHDSHGQLSASVQHPPAHRAPAERPHSTVFCACSVPCEQSRQHVHHIHERNRLERKGCMSACGGWRGTLVGVVHRPLEARQAERVAAGGCDRPAQQLAAQRAVQVVHAPHHLPPPPLRLALHRLRTRLHAPESNFVAHCWNKPIKTCPCGQHCRREYAIPVHMQPYDQLAQDGT